MKRTLPTLALVLAAAACGSGDPASIAGPIDPACTPGARLALAPGETRTMTSTEASCFLVGSGEYVLAGYDARGISALRNGVSASGAGPGYAVSDATVGGARSVAASPGPSFARSAADAPHPHPSSSAVAPSSPFLRSTPWSAGERFQVAPLVGSAPVTARVVRVVAGRYVLAVIESDESGAARVLQQAEEALTYLATEGEPLLGRLLPGAAPVTSAGTGQLLVLATAWNPDLGAGATWTHPDGDAVRSFVWLNTNLRPGYRTGYEMYDHASYRLKVLAHELTHAWQASWSAARGVTGGDAWGFEGGADLVAMDIVRRFLRIGEAGNWKWQDHLQPHRSSVVYALEPVGTEGRIHRGYYDAASFLRDLQWRLVRSGLGFEEAMRQVARGAMEGWFGEACAPGSCDGLSARAAARLGAAWTPENAVLLWTLSQAADDRTPNPELSNPWYHDAGTMDARYGWKAAAELTSGSGKGAAFAGPESGSFFVRLKAGGPESVFAASGTASETRWMIARVR